MSTFQRVLEALYRAREAGEVALVGDKTKREQDDQDCYPRGVVLQVDRTSEVWKTLRFLSKNLDWVLLDTRGKELNLKPRAEFSSRLGHAAFLNAVSDSLCSEGIACAPNIYWR
jgi:hypothetical protein